jgi:hypothetical protein
MPVMIFGEAGGGDLLNAEAVETPVDDEPWEKGVTHHISGVPEVR